MCNFKIQFQQSSVFVYQETSSCSSNSETGENYDNRNSKNYSTDSNKAGN